MKKCFILFATAIAAMTVLSCQKEDDVQTPAKDANLVPMTVFAKNAETKSSLEVEDGEETGRVLWNSTDEISVFDGTANRNFSNALTADNKEAAFSGTVNSSATEFAAVYPYASTATYNSSTHIISVAIPTFQEVSAAGSFAKDANVCVAFAAKDNGITVDGTTATTSTSMQFKNVGGLVKFAISQNNTHKSVTISTTDQSPLTGAITANAETGDADAAEGSVSRVVIAAANGGYLAAGLYYAVVLPFSDKTVSLTFSDGLNSKKRTSKSTISLSRAEIRDLGTIDTGLSAYPSSSEWILTGIKNTQVYAAGKYSSGNNIATANLVQISVDVANKSIGSVTGIENTKLTINKVTSGDYAGTFTIQDANESANYWYAAGSGSNNYLKAAALDENSANFFWDISVNSLGNHTIKARSSNRNTIWFNTSNTIISCYASNASQAPVTLYPYSWVTLTASISVEESERTKDVAASASSVSFTYSTLNIDGDITATVTSDDDSIVDGDPVVGETTVTVNLVPNDDERAKNAQITLSYSGAEDVVLTINQAAYEPVYGWVETAIGSISSSDEFVIVGGGYALPRNGGTSSAPAATSVSLNTDGVSLSGTISDDLKWKLSGNSTDGYSFYFKPNENTTSYLYCNTTSASSNNNNLRVGSGDRKVFVINSNGQLETKDDYTKRYVSIYGTQDWRGYVNTSTTGATCPAIKFYKYVAAPDNREEAGMSWSAENATATYTTVNNANSLAFTAPTLTEGNATGITYESTDETIATISDAGVVSINLTDNNVKVGSTTIKAIFEGDEDYKPQTVSYTLNVVDNRMAATTPSFSTAAGEVAANTVVTFLPSDQGLTFHYTVNGSEPTVSSPTAASVTIDAAKTVKVLATKTGYKPSAVASATYTIAGGGSATYQHIFSAKPSTGNNVMLSSVSWNISAEQLGSYNSNNYAGVQIGTSKASGSITLTSSSAWAYQSKTKITAVRVWMNAGSDTPSATVTIGGVSAVSDGTTVVKNSSASSYEDATCVTYTPGTNGDTGVVVIAISTASKAGYVCAIEIDSEN